MKFKIKRNQTPMTNLDVICRILAETTGRPEARFRHVICSAIESGHSPAANWLKPADPTLYEQLQAEKAGVLNWLLEGQLPTT